MHSGRWLAEQMVVPANSSRFFDDPEEARCQPTAHVQLAWNDVDPYLFNAAFDQQLIAHDETYCTSVADLTGAPQMPTLGYIDRVLDLVGPTQIVDIGCGQGEFVRALRRIGIDARGFDPVLRTPGRWLIDRYWSPGDTPSAGLFVMRCVLPHIAEPWEWVRSLGAVHPGALLLVEYQRVEWMAENAVWYQLSHDHVNLFRLADFTSRFDVVASGVFSSNEWAWVLFRPDTYRPPERQSPTEGRSLVAQLQDARRSMADRLRDRSVVLWGAAGKGIVLSHALLEAGVQVRYAIDADPMRWGRHMEVSATKVVPPDVGVSALKDSELVICNPSHADAVWSYISPRRS